MLTKQQEDDAVDLEEAGTANLLSVMTDVIEKGKRLREAMVHCKQDTYVVSPVDVEDLKHIAGNQKPTRTTSQAAVSDPRLVLFTMTENSFLNSFRDKFIFSNFFH